MKGYFTLRLNHYDAVSFGNLGENGEIGYLNDMFRSEYDRSGMLIAHDVIEHSLSHRTKRTVTLESEIRAFGAIEFVRGGDGFDMWRDLYYMLADIHRDIKPVPYLVGAGLIKSNSELPDLMRYLIQKGMSPSNARNTAFHYYWGNKQKADQFGWCNYTARQAFSFIENNVKQAIYDLDERMSAGVTIYFDTVNRIFRHTHKWDY